MVRTEVKMEELLGKLEVLEKRQKNVEIKMDISTNKIQDQVKEHDIELEMSAKVIQDLKNTTTSYFYGREKSLEVFDQRLDDMFKNITEGMHHSPIAFFATLSSGFTTSSSHQTLVFNNVVTDVCGGYNPGTGVFTASVEGLYSFSTSIMVVLSTSTTTAQFRIEKNGSVVVYIYVNDIDGTYEAISGTVILSLQVEDTVKVTYDESGRYIFGNH